MRSYASKALVLAVFVYTVSLAIDGYCQSSEQKAQLFFFTNAACGPCRQVEPEIERLFRDGYSVMKVDTQLHPDWTARFQVQKTPTVILAVGNQVVARHSGYVDAGTLKGWFRQVEQAARQSAPPRAPQRELNNEQRGEMAATGASPTKGFYQPENSVEETALAATVRLKIEDPLGTSYATGTVIHSHKNESLVLTCGHVFRESNGTGNIVAEYGFTDGNYRTASGELLFYDADERDIGLIAIRTETMIQPVKVAALDYPITRGDTIFSIGCDQGERPSIRRSQVKNQAKYDGVNKYEIFGRPVNGRSGGGMFTEDGRLLGVCNAAVVDVDEGVYVGLDTIYWQFDRTNLTHLFDGRQRRESFVDNRQSNDLGPIVGNSRQRSPVQGRDLSDIPVRNSESPDSRIGIPRTSLADSSVASVDETVRMPGVNNPLAARDANAVSINQVSDNRDDAGMELIVMLRDRESQKIASSWTVANPDVQLVDQIRAAQQGSGQQPSQPNRLAQLRRDMPDLQKPADRYGRNYRATQIRAQSPK